MGEKVLSRNCISLTASNISSLVIEWLCDQVSNRNIAIAGLYCDYLAQEEQSTTNMLGTILRQLIEKDGIPEHVRQAFRDGKRGFGGRAVRLSDLAKLLKTTITMLPQVFICIDGLDECLPTNRRELLEPLQEIVRASPATRVFLSGRPHIRDEIKIYFDKAIVMPVIPPIEDIKRYLKMRLDRDPIPRAMDDHLRAKIMRAIPERISQMHVGTVTILGLVGYPLIMEYRFLLVSLNIDAVLEEVTIHQRKKRLDQMAQGNGLRDAYSATLARIKAQKGSKSKLGIQALMWLSHSERPLNVDELCHALGVEIGTTDLNYRNIPAIETLLGCSLGLITVEASTYAVRLVHYTLQEYLSDNTDLFHSPHAVIAEACLTYLNFQCIRDLSRTDHWPWPQSLLQYASYYWGTHARREITKSVNTLALNLLDGFDKHVSSEVLLSRRCDNWDSRLRQCNSTGFTGLHCTAYLGIVEITVALLEMKKWDLNATDVKGNTAISWAVRKGHGAIVEILLAQEDAILGTADENGRTPQSWAVINKREDIVKTLLEREDVTPNTVDKDGQTSLSLAIERGHGAIVKMLLEREDIIPDIADQDGRTPLSWAAERGYEDVVKMLLGRKGVAPNAADGDGRTPLLWAAKNRRGAVIKMLLEREDITPDTPDEDGRTPLSWAAEYGYGDVVKILLGRKDVAPDAADGDGRTPLLWAAKNRRGAVINIVNRRSSPYISHWNKLEGNRTFHR